MSLGTPGTPDPYGELLDAAPCPRHPGREARLRCAKCQTRICADCGALFDGRRVCEACLQPVAVKESLERDSPERRKRRDRSMGVFFVLGVMVILGLFYAALLPSIGRAKRRAVIRAGGPALGRVFEAARLYAQDNRGLLPVPGDRRVFTLSDDLERQGYLRKRPKELVDGRVVTTTAKLGDDHENVYAVEDAPHPSPDDDLPKRWLLCVNGQVHELSVTDTARALDQGTIAGVVTGTASAWFPFRARAVPGTATPTAAATAGGSSGPSAPAAATTTTTTTTTTSTSTSTSATAPTTTATREGE